MMWTRLGAQFGVDGRPARIVRTWFPPIAGDADVFAHGATAPGLLRNPALPVDVTTVETADGARIHVREYGPRSAPRIVLIHGYACRIEYWNPQINQLADRYRVVVYDQRGFGRSTHGAREFSVDALGDDLSEVLAALVPAGEQTVIAGHSLGGIAMMSWAARHPEQVQRYARAVLLIDTVAERFSANTLILPFPGLDRARRERFLNYLLGRMPVPHPRFLGPLFRFTVLAASTPRAETAFTEALIAACPNPFRTRAPGVLAGLDVSAGLAHMKVPTTVLVGVSDRLTPPSASRRIVELLRANGTEPRYVELPRLGHCTTLEDPAVVTPEIEHALEAGSAGRAAG
ncbi:alpha/beta fold hydrolase [Nocardia huaxiensis]|uniref:alpha/beta fold hydrolase n=1 Tax=Nocardia huaxiensis TaxID=2755382 RepID=UPI001E43F3BC|nr:alpha/beta hydrolase [Nocardia huaxiensis]UFS95938.1 alpha/beta hydrolase [Nocardia huaxiensis]